MNYGGDGKVFLRLAGELITDMSQATLLEDESRDFARSSISRLDFNLDSNLVSKVNETKKKFVLLRSDMPFQQVICDDFDYALIKKRKLSPDFIVKLTAQLAFYTMHMRFPVAIDVASTAFYKDGQSAESLIVTQESAAFVNAAVANERVSDKGRLFDLLTAASRTNQMRIFDTMQGKSFYYHFLTLEYLAEELGEKIPLFESKLYWKTKRIDFSIYPMYSDVEFAILPYTNVEDGSSWEVSYEIGPNSGKLNVICCSVDAGEYLSHIKSSLSTIMDVVKNGAQ
ncbi:peroxisomal carnitine O-octanoyltransferase-like [Corticium candelabrum]|uniref:peroxisomal carnitine O-octanoyltransferase-like n=1 Tax=Corticium candelabrum TaxID=121492 RepID=UPI002E268B6B|nr:peroxisomal carnitine O-octanoyltransferase-like [Corticium candelabrum]